MKKFIYSFCVLVLFVSLFTACQTESTVEIYSTKETIIKTTPLTTYIERVVMQKTSQDNIIDKSNCFMVKLPYIVTVNNVQISVNTVNDYQLVQMNINAYSNDNDIVNIHYPVTVILNDYSEKILENQNAFNNLIIECQANSKDFGKINCITINFPITINVYDSSNQIASTASIINNKLLYSFFENLEDNKFIAISYPITITNSNGQNTVVTTNSQFEDLIKSAVDTCPDNTIPSLDFIQTLVSNSWKISYYFHESEKTSAYDGYTFTFNSNYKVVATKSGISYNGTWSTKVDNGVREFEIKFESDPLGKLNEGWKVFEFNNSQLRFRHTEDINDNDYLYFEKQ
ncbi:hypothetical protein [Flavobacterium sp.]|uniref:hypothetical protein n=1 Tax=Flavobacterium sp. TaxID=239 RepID=UPI00375065C5